MQTITPFLMFDGKAEEAMNFYTSLFPGSEILRIERYQPHEAGAEGSVKLAAFSLQGREYRCIDSAMKHDFSFTPSFSLFVDCNTEEEVDRLFAQLSQDGAVLMPLGAYPFSRKFGWLADRYGISWQLNLIPAP